MSPVGSMEDPGGLASLGQCLPADPRSEPLARARELAQCFFVSGFSAWGFMPGRGAMHPRLGGKPSVKEYAYLWGVFRKPSGGSHGQSRADSESE
jgi:hypothetical protein